MFYLGLDFNSESLTLGCPLIYCLFRIVALLEGETSPQSHVCAFIMEAQLVVYQEMALMLTL